MYISSVHIENFRNFSIIDVPLKQFSIIVGKNDSGKSNLIDAINILLYNNKGNYYTKTLSKYDFNSSAVKEFQRVMSEVYAGFAGNFDVEKYIKALLERAPKVVIKLRFSDARNAYEQGLLKDWLNGNGDEQYFDIEYTYSLRNQENIRKQLLRLKAENLLDDNCHRLDTYLDFYDYDLVSTNNNKPIDFRKIQNFCANTIDAERDAFSSGDSAVSTKVISKIISNSLDIKDYTQLVKKYDEFFQGIQELRSFKSVYKDIVEQNETIKQFIEEINLKPNAKKYKDILDNITLAYGQDMLFQRGLGTRNLILLLTLYSYFLNEELKRFNLVCIEEPESHLDTNNLQVANDFFKKAKNRSSYVQLLISTHNNQIINKLELDNITLLANDHSAITFSDIDRNLKYYLAKRENFDTLNLLFAAKVILVEGATEEIYLNCLFDRDKINNIRVIAIGQKGFKTFIELWKAFHANTTDKLGILRDFDYQATAQAEHEAYNSESICIKTTTGKEFEADFVNQDNNLELLNALFACKENAQQMYERLTEDKLNNIIRICEASETKTAFVVPSYISSLLEWIKR